MIPARIMRTVSAYVNGDQERLWQSTVDLHPGYECITLRDPLDRDAFPMTAEYWPRCHNGAQLAGLVRLEWLWHHGGIYLDADVALHHHLGPLRRLTAFACYEDLTVVPDAVLGAQAQHPAIGACLDLAIARLTGRSGEPSSWMTDRGAWATGPGVTTTVLPGRGDVLLLPPAAFYGVHYAPRDTLPERLEVQMAAPPAYAFGTHLWEWSWKGTS